MTYKWQTLPSGLVQVDDGGRIGTPSLAGQELAIFRAKVMRWRELAEKHSARTGVPVHWILGVIWAETHGDPSLTSPVGAYGLMQVMPFNWGGRSKEQMRDPDTNMLVGTNILAAAKARGFDLPRVASCYNAGAQKSGQPHPSPVSPWGMRENKGYISHVVQGANTALAELAAGGPSQDPPKAMTPETALTVALVGWKVARFMGWT